MVGLETLPRRMTRLLATRPSVGLVVSCSSPMSPFSPGAPLGQSMIGLGASDVDCAATCEVRQAIRIPIETNCASGFINLPVKERVRFHGKIRAYTVHAPCFEVLPAAAHRGEVEPVNLRRNHVKQATRRAHGMGVFFGHPQSVEFIAPNDLAGNAETLDERFI